jgi:hypothetical protein
MAYRLNEHDRKVATFGIAAAVVMLMYAYVLAPWAEDWRQTRAAVAANRKTVESLLNSVGRRMNQAAVVPVMTMPIETEKQQHLFKTKFNEQLNAIGIQVKSLQYVTTGKTPNNLGFTVSKLKCDGKCTMGQAAKLLGSLGENPYLLGIDEFRLSCDPKKRDEMTLSITVSTFCRND